jgi:hypothetical protein
MLTIMHEVQRAFDREFGSPSDLDDLERLIHRELPDEPDDPSDWDPDPDGEAPDLFDDVDDVGRDD